MFKAPKIIYGGNFKPPLVGIGNFKDPEQSMFTKTPPKKPKEENIEEEETDQSKSPNPSSPQKTPAADKDKKIDGKEESVVEEGKDPPVKTATVKTGRIQFAGIVLPPEAPTDLICEECERENAIYYCGACVEVFCFKCCDLCHPRISANDLMHQHEKDGRIRGLIYGDTSRIKTKVVDDTFYLPNNLFYFDDYNKVKDLMKPNSLTTSEQARQKDAQSVANKEQSANIIKQMKPKYEVKQMVLFTDPATEKPAYGSIISQWDYVHGQSAPAIIRGDEAPVYYYVQIMGQLVNVENLESLLPKDKPSEVDRKQMSSIYNKRERLAKELDDAPLRKEYDMGKQLTKRIKELNNLIALGPKYHLRDVTDNNGKLDYAEELKRKGIILGAEAGYDEYSSTTESGLEASSTTEDSESASYISLHSAASLPAAMQRRKQILPSDSHAAIGAGGHGIRGGGGAPPRRHQNIAQQGWDTKRLQEFQAQITPSDLKEEIEERKKRKAVIDTSDRGEVYNTNGNQAPIRMYGLGIGANDEYADSNDPYQVLFQRKSAEEVINSIEYRSVDNQYYNKLDLSLYADVEIDDQSMLSNFNANQRPLPAHMRSYQHLVKDKVTVAQSNRVLDSLKDILHKKEDMYNIPTLSQPHGGKSGGTIGPGGTNYTIKENIDVNKEMLNIIVLPETSIESMKERVEFYKARQKMLLEQALNRNDFIWLRVQMKLKFNVWKRSLNELKEKKKDYLARRIQTRARVWLCRNKLQECRDWWDAYYKAKRNAVHSRFRYAKPTDKYAVTFDNKIYFKTLTDMNRYAYFMRVCATKVVLYFERKKRIILKQAITRWKDAIYEFLEKSLQNEHIQKHLFSAEDLDIYEDEEALKRLAKDDVFQAKEKILQQHDHLLAYISPLYQSVIKNHNHKDKNDTKNSSSKGIAFGGNDEQNGEGERKGDSPNKNSSTAERYYYSNFYDEFGYETISAIPLRIQPVAKINPYVIKNDDGSEGKGEGDDSDSDILMPLSATKSHLSVSNSATSSGGGGRGAPPAPIRLEQDSHVPAYDPSRTSTLPPLLKLGRPKSFRDRLYHDLQHQMHLLPAEMRKEYRELLAAEYAIEEEKSKTLDGGVSSVLNGGGSAVLDDSATVASAVTASTGVTNAGTATTSAVGVPKTTKTPLSTYKSLMTGPTNQSYWMIPEILMIGNAPLGNSHSVDFSVYDPVFNTGLVDYGEDIPERDKKKPSSASSKSKKKSEISCITALLLVGVNVFVSLMSEEEENALLYFYDQTVIMRGEDDGSSSTSMKLVGSTKTDNPATDSTDQIPGSSSGSRPSTQPPPPTGASTKSNGNRYAVKPMQQRLNEELKAAKRTAMRMVGDYTEIIRKQQASLGKIPRFGRTDPRYAAAHREIMRCEARISLARSNIVKIRQQIKHLPKMVTYLRLPVSEYPLPWNREMILPSLWMLEYLIHHRDEKIKSNVVSVDTKGNVVEAEEDKDEDPSALLSQLADSNPVIDEKLDRNPNKQFRDSPNVFFETKIAEKPQTNVYYVYGGGPFQMAEDGLSKDGRAGLLGAMVLGRLYRLDPLEVIYRWQRAHDAMGIYTFSTVPKKTFNMISGKDPVNKHYNTYKTPVPPLPWMRSLLIDTMQFSHRPLEPLHYRMNYDPDSFASAYEDKNYYPVGDQTTNNSKLKINNLNYDNKSVYDEEDMAALAAFNKGVNVRGGAPAAAPTPKPSVPDAKSAENILNKAKVETYDDDDDAGSTVAEDESAIINRILMEKEYAADFDERPRLKQSLYFEHYL